MCSHPVKCSTSNEISICKIGNHCKNANAHTLEKQELVIGPKKKFFFVVKFSVVIIYYYNYTHLSSNRGSFQKKTLDWEDNQTLINCTQMTFAVIGSRIPKEMK